MKNIACPFWSRDQHGATNYFPTGDVTDKGAPTVCQLVFFTMLLIIKLFLFSKKVILRKKKYFFYLCTYVIETCWSPLKMMAYSGVFKKLFLLIIQSYIKKKKCWRILISYRYFIFFLCSIVRRKKFIVRQIVLYFCYGWFVPEKKKICKVKRKYEI